MDPRYLESGTTLTTSPLAGEQERVIKDAPGKLFYLRVCNTTGAAIFVFLFNGGANTDPILCPPIPVPANGQTELDLDFAHPFSEGLTIGSSTGQVAYVAAGANSLQIHAITK